GRFLAMRVPFVFRPTFLADGFVARHCGGVGLPCEFILHQPDDSFAKRGFVHWSENIGKSRGVCFCLAQPKLAPHLPSLLARFVNGHKAAWREKSASSTTRAASGKPH